MIWLYIIACIIAIFDAIYVGRALWDRNDSIIIKSSVIIISILSFIGAFLAVILVYILIYVLIHILIAIV